MVKRPNTESLSYGLLFAVLASLPIGCGGGSGNGGNGGGGATPPNVPNLMAIAPSTTVVGAATFTLSLYGSNFVNNEQIPTVQWNGAAVVAQWISTTQMMATIPASDMTALGTAMVTVTNPSPNGGTSGVKTFIITNAPPVTTLVRTVPGISTPPDLVQRASQNVIWDAAHAKLYVTIPGEAPVSPNTIVAVDPVAGTASTPVAAGNEPDLLSISSDSSYLWVGLDGDHAVQRFLLPGLTKDISIPLPTDSSGNPQQPVSLQAAPVSPHALALMPGNWETEPDSTGVYIYDDATVRPTAFSGVITNGITMEWLQWGSDDSTIYGSQYHFSSGGIGTLSVTASGVTLKSYNGGVPGMQFTQYNPGTGLLYTIGTAFNPVTGGLAGRFDYPDGQTACVADSTLGRYYCVDGYNPFGGPTFYDMWVYDLNSYTPLDRIFFGYVGEDPASSITGLPEYLVRWGNAGLALTTSTYPYMGNGGFFLIDGAAVNPKVAPDFSTGASTMPYTSLASLSPQQAPSGSPDVLVTVSGSNFAPTSTACLYYSNLKFQYLPTNYVSPQQLTFTIPAGLLATPGQLPINLFEASTNLSSTGTLSFAVTPPTVSGSATQVNAINLTGLAMAWDPASELLYVGTADYDATYPNSIVAVSGETGSIVKTQTVGSDPYVLSVSSGGQYLYAGFAGATTMTQLQLPGLSSPLTWTLNNPASTAVYWAGDMGAAPVSPDATAVTLFDFSSLPPETGGVVVYDDNVLRPDFAPGFGQGGGVFYDTLAWGASDEILGGAISTGGPLDEFQVGPSGVSLLTVGTGNFNYNYAEIHSDFGTGLIYSDDGNVADPTTQAIVGTYNASGLAAPDSSLNRVFILGQTTAQANTSNYTIQSFDEKAYTPVSSITLDDIIGSPIQMVRWGSSGLAILTQYQILDNYLFGTAGMLYLVEDSNFVSKAQPSSPAVINAEKRVQRRWKRISRADIVRAALARSGSRVP